MRAPRFWGQASGGGAAAMLAPAGWLYGLGTRLRLATSISWRPPVPVICIGNLTVGGNGKTPVAMDVAHRLKALGANPHLLTRGYGGSQAGPLLVDPDVHDAQAVGDEALLLANVAPTWVARQRAIGGAMAVTAGAGSIIMDDGFQNPALVKDLSIVVADGAYGFGNQHLMPAGPLRESVAGGLARAHALTIIGDDTAGVAETAVRLTGGRLPILTATVQPRADSVEALRGRRVVAFAGIARPERFFVTLERIGCTVVARFPFPDHHVFTAAELASIEARVENDTLLVTTAKDAVRLPPNRRDRVAVLSIDIRFTDESILDNLLSSALESRS